MRGIFCSFFMFSLLMFNVGFANAEQFTQSMNFESSVEKTLWGVGSWGECDAVCPTACGYVGGNIEGEQDRPVTCKKASGASVAQNKCDAYTPPLSDRVCKIGCLPTEACVPWNSYSYPWPSRGTGTVIYPGQEITLQLSADLLTGSNVAEVNSAIAQWKQDVQAGNIQMREIKITSGSGAACNSTGPGSIYLEFMNFFETGSTSGYRTKTYPMMSRAKLLSYNPTINPRGTIPGSIKFDSKVYSHNYDGINFSSFVKAKLSFDIEGVSPESVKNSIKAEIDREMQGLVNDLKRYTNYNILPAQIMDTIDYSQFDDVGTCTYEIDWENKQQVTATTGFARCKSANKNHPDVEERCEYETLGRGYGRTWSSQEFKKCMKTNSNRGACHDQVHGAALKTEW